MYHCIGKACTSKIDSSVIINYKCIAHSRRQFESNYNQSLNIKQRNSIILIIRIKQKMSATSITLVNDPDQVAQINSQKVLVAVPLLYAFMTHYLFQALRLIKSEHEKAERLNDHGKRLFLYGVAALFSMNFLQSSVMMTIMAWITLVCIIVNHCFVFLKETGQKYHNNGLLVYYGLLMIWFISIVFFYIYNANNATNPNSGNS